MEIPVRRIGNSQGVLLPKALLRQLGVGATLDLQVRDGVIELRPVPPKAREGWAQDAQRIAADAGADAAWPELPVSADDEWRW